MSIEKMAEKIAMNITEEQNEIFEKVNKEQFALDVSGSFASVEMALKTMKKIITDLEIKSGDVALVETKEDKKHNQEQIKLVKQYRTPLKKKRADVNKALKAYSKGVLNNFDELITEFDVVVDYMEAGVEIYDEEQRKFREKEKRLIFDGIQSQFPGFTFTWDDKYINSSREVIEEAMLNEMKAAKEKAELLQMKKSFAENKINHHSKEYALKTEISFEAISHMFNFEEMTNEEIDEIAEKYVVSIQVLEAEAEEKAEAKRIAEEKQKAYDEEQARLKAEKEAKEAEKLKNNTIITILEYTSAKSQEELEKLNQETLNYILESEKQSIIKAKEAEKEKARKEAEEKLQAEKKEKEKQAKLEAEKKAIEKGQLKTKTLLISVEVSEDRIDDISCEIESLLLDLDLVHYACKIKGE